MNELKEKIARAICEADTSGPTCVMAEHPERPPCTNENCNRFAMVEAALRAIEEAGYVVAPRKPTIEIWGVICGVMLVGVFAVLARCLEWALS